MKKLIALLLALVMMMSLVACGENSENTDPSTEPSQGPSDKDLSAAASVETVANALMNKYAEYANIRQTYDEYMAEMPAEEQISYEEFLSYQLSCMPVDTAAEELWLMGFAEAPAGFTEAYCYQPMMMGQAFIGYVFRVAEGTDIEAFKNTLKETCDPRWNICTMANTVVCESFGDLVYFSMMVVADEENPFGFTAEQKDGFYNTFVETIKGGAAN